METSSKFVLIWITASLLLNVSLIDSRMTSRIPTRGSPKSWSRQHVNQGIIQMGSIAEHRFTNEATDDDHISDENDNALDDNDDKTLNDFLETRNDDDDDGQQQENIIDDTNNGGGGDGDDTDDDNDDYDDKDNDDDEYPDGENLLKNIKSDDQQYYELYLDSAHKIHLMWDVDYTENDILIEVHANVPLNAWIAIGFSDYGEEENGDFCILWWDNWNKAHFQDTWTDSEGILQIDKKQDCRLLRLQRANDRVVYMYRRKFDTCDDDQDYILDDGTVHILYAMKNGPIDTPQGLSIPTSIHGFQRAQMLKTKVETPKFPRDVRTFSVLSNKAHVPNAETTYWCRVVKLPEMKSKKHIIKFEAVIQPGHETLVHHIEVYHCEINFRQKAPRYDGPCSSSKKPIQLEPCKKVIAAWAMGAQPLIYPEEAGLPIGGKGYAPYAMLEIHYNNEDLRDDYVDSSGIRFYYTSKLRLHDAAVLEVGLEYTPKMAIPPQQEHYVLSGHCIIECTEVAIPPNGIVLFAAQLHTHLTGKQVIAKHYRGGIELPEMARDNHYSPHFQEIRTLKHPVLVLPGDALVVSCTYNTMERENITLGGFAIREEMCVSYIHYYPKTYLEVCKSSIDSDILNEYFRFMNEFENQPTSPEKTVPENYQSIDWTPLRAEMLHELYDLTTLSMQCNKSSGDRFPGYWNNMPQTRVVWPLPEVPRECDTTGEYTFNEQNDEKMKH